MRFPTPLLAAIALLVGSGCATVSSSVMVPENLAIEGAVGGTVTVETVGSDRQGMVGRRLIEPDALREAVRESILRAKLFDEVVEMGAADRLLTVGFERIEEPGIGLDARCKLAMRWRLQSADRTRTLWEEVVTTEETVNSFEEPSSALRGQAVVEKTIRANIRKGLERLSKGLSGGFSEGHSGDRPAGG